MEPHTVRIIWLIIIIWGTDIRAFPVIVRRTSRVLKINRKKSSIILKRTRKIKRKAKTIKQKLKTNIKNDATKNV